MDKQKPRGSAGIEYGEYTTKVRPRNGTARRKIECAAIVVLQNLPVSTHSGLCLRFCQWDNDGYIIVAEMRARLLFLLMVLALALTGCWKDSMIADAGILGDVDIRLDRATFGYLNDKLGALPLGVSTCTNDGTSYTDCTEAKWGSGGLVSARFIVRPGAVFQGSIGDSFRPVAVWVNSYFRGTLCGVRIDEVMKNKVACGKAISVPNYGTDRHDVLW